MMLTYSCDSYPLFISLLRIAYDINSFHSVLVILIFFLTITTFPVNSSFPWVGFVIKMYADSRRNEI